jgi:hypothetical protein
VRKAPTDHPGRNGSAGALAAQGGKQPATQRCQAFPGYGDLRAHKGSALCLLLALGGKLEVLCKRLNLGVTRVALAVLDAENGVVSNAAFLGDLAQLTYPFFEGGAHIGEKVSVCHAPIIGHMCPACQGKSARFTNESGARCVGTIT